MHNGEDSGPFIERIGLKITQAIESYQVCLILLSGAKCKRYVVCLARERYRRRDNGGETFGKPFFGCNVSLLS
jgi:hypothetical protein